MAAKRRSAVRVARCTDTSPAALARILPLIEAYMRDPMGGALPWTSGQRVRLIELLSAHSGLRIALAVDTAGDAPIGCALGFRNISTFAARPFINIHDLIVLPEWRGRGVGRLLLAEMETIAREEGCSKVTLEVREDNAAALALYEKAGFEHCRPPMYYLQKTLPTKNLTSR